MRAASDVQVPRRDVSIDILRGIAIVMMVGANMSPILALPHSLFFRVYGSLPAPIFILVAGMMVEHSQIHRQAGRTIGYYLKRGGFLMLAGAFVDMTAWRIIPFITVDVLYLIGLSLPLVYLISKCSTRMVCAFAMYIFALTPLLQHILGYAEYPGERWLSGQLVLESAHPSGLLNHWLVDGWFPFFPWAGFALLGIVFARWRWQENGEIRSFAVQKPVRLALLLAVLGAIYWYYFPGAMYERKGFTEIFYPPTLGIMLFALGFILLLFILADATRHWVGWQFVRCFGEAPLFMYILHIVVIGRLLLPIFPDMQASTYLVVYFWFLVWLLVIGWVLRVAKHAINRAPIWVQWLMGGSEV